MELKSGYKHTEAGIIPEDWEVVLLDSIAKRGSGHTPNKKHPEYWGGQIKWISLQDTHRLDRLYIYDTTAKITPAGIANSSAIMHSAGMVVLSRDAGVGKSAIMKDNMAVSQHFIAWKCSSSLDNHFLYYWLQSNKREFERIAMGNTIKTIGLPYFKQLAIPLPSTKAEQEAIAKALSDADILIESLEQLIVKKRDIKQGAMQELLTGRKRLPGFSREWKSKLLGQICEISIGRTPPRLNSAMWGRGYKWLSIADLKTKVVSESKEEITELAAAEMRVVPQGTLLMSFKLSIGRLCFAGCDLYTNEAICSFNNLQANAEFLYYVLSRTDFSLYGKQAVKGYTLNKESLKLVEIRLPSKSEQAAIATILSDIDTEIVVLEEKLTKARHTKQGMMQTLLTGRIRLV